MKQKMEAATFKGTGFRIFWQMGAIVLLAITIGFTVNQIRPDRLRLVADWSVEAQLAQELGRNMVISLEEARELCSSKRAIFFDARSRDLYEQAHTLCARNLSWEAVDEYLDAVMADIP